MKPNKTATTAVLTIAALGIGVGTANADPAPPPSAPNIGYQMHLDGRTLVTTLTNGAFRITADGQAVDIDDVSGHAAVQLPLSFGLNDVSYPLRHQVSPDGRVLQLTPPANVKATGPLELKLVASPVENSRAESYFTQQLQTAWYAGGYIGTIIGGIVGLLSCVIPVTCPVTLPGFLLLGTVIGGIAVGGPTFVASGMDLMQTLQARPGTTHWVDPSK